MRPMPAGTTHSALLQQHRAVADWCVRREQPGWTAADERALQAWLDADPQRREIMDSMGRTLRLAGQLKQFRAETSGAQAAAAPQPATAGARRAPWLTPARRRSFAPALVAACVALVVAGWWRWDATPSYRLDLATGPGETRAVDLPDGSQIALNVGTRVQVRYYPRRREVLMGEGEAFFRVAPNASQPFTIDSGDSRVRVVGTAFNVRAAPPQLTVKVLEGKVEVQPRRSATAEPALLLGPGVGVAIDTASGRHQSLRAAPDEVGRWRTGQIHFSRTTLGEVAQELGRYLGKSVTVDDEGLKAMTISGFLMIHSADDFIQALPDVVPVRVERDPVGNWLISRR
ncbi:FecR domain-containing protein [Pantoea sp. 18069]|uniref:FecR family protein n=1 Tax=Pantoea sp. 18069 TaxID=2681415 RepID=UPI00190F535E|nr:FecR domain-containing protein [Pantoea sp. 18069]